MALSAFIAPQFPELARADNAVPAKDKKKAAELFKKSVDAYRKGDFQTTVDLLTQAYALDPQPVLLYNLARAQEGLGNSDAAIDAYEKFLAQEPKAADRGAIEQRLATLRRQRDERVAAQKAREGGDASDPNNPPSKTKQPPPPPPDEPPPPRKRNIFPFVVGGAGVAALGVGVVTGLMAKSGESDANAEPKQDRAIEQRDSAETLATISTTTFIIGGVLLAAGAGWFVIDTSSKKTGGGARSPQVALGLGFIGLQGVLP
jgi:tetratricopeptide (TPR) repeat protein